MKDRLIYHQVDLNNLIITIKINFHAGRSTICEITQKIIHHEQISREKSKSINSSNKKTTHYSSLSHLHCSPIHSHPYVRFSSRYCQSSKASQKQTAWCGKILNKQSCHSDSLPRILQRILIHSHRESLLSYLRQVKLFLGGGSWRSFEDLDWYQQNQHADGKQLNENGCR